MRHNCRALAAAIIITSINTNTNISSSNNSNSNSNNHYLNHRRPHHHRRNQLTDCSCSVLVRFRQFAARAETVEPSEPLNWRRNFGWLRAAKPWAKFEACSSPPLSQFTQPASCLGDTPRPGYFRHDPLLGLVVVSPSPLSARPYPFRALPQSQVWLSHHDEHNPQSNLERLGGLSATPRGPSRSPPSEEVS